MEPYAIVALLLSSAVVVLAATLVRGKYGIKASRPQAAQGTIGIDKQHLEQQLAAAVELNEQILAAAPIGILWVARKTPLGDSDLRLLNTIADMTAAGLQRAALLEQSLRNAADLEEVVAERTRELTEANQRLQELDKLKSKFVSDVSHELIMAPVNRDEVLATVVAAQEPRAEDRSLTLHYQPSMEAPWVLGDQGRLEQVVTNLVANAVNYTPSGCVKVRSVPGAAPGTIQFEVEDTGIGIYPEDIPHLFERFYRGRRDQVSDVPGTGLGLVIVKELVDRHGGTISVQSDVGVGTVFTVTLPAAPPYEHEVSSKPLHEA